MACIYLKKNYYKITELTTNEKKDKNANVWKALDAITKIEENVMYYAFDISKVLGQAKSSGDLPVLLKIEKGEMQLTILALKKAEIKSNSFPYYRYGAATWPPAYETVKSHYGPGNVLDYKNGQLVKK